MMIGISIVAAAAAAVLALVGFFALAVGVGRRDGAAASGGASSGSEWTGGRDHKARCCNWCDQEMSLHSCPAAAGDAPTGTAEDLLERPDSCEIGRAHV